MKKSHLIPYLIFFVSFFSCGEEEYASKRVITDKIKLKQLFDISYPGRITRFFCDSLGIYVSGDPEAVIFMYDNKGRFIKKMGKRGTAPWETSSIWYFSRDNNTSISNNYWVHDYTKQLIKKYSYKNDSLISYSKVITRNNVLFIGNEKFLIPRLLENTKGKFVLSIYDNQTHKFIKDIDILSKSRIDFDQEPFQDYTFYGEFCKQISKDKVVFYCLWSGCFFIIDIKTYEVALFKDMRGLPIARGESIGGRIVLKPSQIAFISGTVINDNIFLLTADKGNFYVDKYGKFFVDIYDLISGKYINSFEVTPPVQGKVPTNIDSHNNKLMINYGSEDISVYEIKLGK